MPPCAGCAGLAVLAPEWLQQIAPEPWYERYGRRIEDYRLPTKPAERTTYAQQVGEDGEWHRFV